jgi:hypothetical protein
MGNVMGCIICRSHSYLTVSLGYVLLIIMTRDLTDTFYIGLLCQF